MALLQSESMASSRLPQELIDAIVDLLASDAKSLRRLLSASRAFGGRVRMHLYRTLHVDIEISERWATLCPDTDEIITIAADDASVATVVRSIHLRVLSAGARTSSYTPISGSKLRSCLAIFKHLVSIVLDSSFELHENHHRDLIATLVSPIPLQRVTLDRNHTTASGLLTFLSDFHHVPSIHVDLVNITSHRDIVGSLQSKSNASSSASEIIIRRSSSVLRLFASLPPFPIRHLVLLWLDEPEYGVCDSHSWDSLQEIILKTESLQKLYLQITTACDALPDCKNACMLR